MAFCLGFSSVTLRNVKCAQNYVKADIYISITNEEELVIYKDYIYADIYVYLI